MRDTSWASAPFAFVIAGHVPAVRVCGSLRGPRRGRVDARNKSAHDGTKPTDTGGGQRRIER